MALCWHFVNVRHVTFWVSSGLSSFPSLFLPLIQFSTFFFFSSLFHFTTFPSASLSLLFLSHHICHSLFYSLSASIIMAKQYHVQYSCDVYFPQPFYCHPQTLTKYSWWTPSLPSLPTYFMIILYNIKGSGNFKHR